LATADYLADFRAPFNFTLIEARVSIFEKGLSTGTIEMDVRKGATADVDLSTSIFTTQPSILLSGASDFDESSNAVFDAGQKDVLEGEYLFLDMSQLPATENMKTWRVYLIGEAS